MRVGLVQAGIARTRSGTPRDAWSNLDRHLELTRAGRAAGRAARGLARVGGPVPTTTTTPDAGRAAAEPVRRDSGSTCSSATTTARPTRRERVCVGAKMLDPRGDARAALPQDPARALRRVRAAAAAPHPRRPRRREGRAAGGRLHARAPSPRSRRGRRATASAAFICYEAIFPDLVRRFAGAGAELLVNITNDAWYGRTSAPYQHLAMAAFRAVENGRYLVRAANTGITAVVDPRGRVLERTTLFERTVLVRDVPFVPGPPSTPATATSSPGPARRRPALAATLLALPGLGRKRTRSASSLVSFCLCVSRAAVALSVLRRTT